MAVDLAKLRETLGQLETERTGFDSHWQELIDYLLWFRPNIVSSGPAGIKKMDKIRDATGTRAARRFAAGFSARNANKSLRWFTVAPEDDYYKDHKGVKLWTGELVNLYYTNFRRSNFYTTDQDATLDWGIFGTGVIFAGKHPRWKTHYQRIDLGECYPGVDQFGQVNSLFRKFEFTVNQMAEKWGRNQLSEKARGLLDSNKGTEKLTIVHAVYPRTERDVRKVDNLNMPFADVYFEYGENHLLEEKGFMDFPYSMSRFDVMPGEVLGRGLGMEALPDVKELQIRVRDTTKAGQLRMEPPVIAPYDGFAGAPIKRIPRGVTFVRSDTRRTMQDMIGQFPVANDMLWPEESNEAMRRAIRDTFMYELMTLALDKTVTLGEFQEVAQDKMQTLGPALERLQDERYKPLFDRTFTLLWDQGLVPPPPPELIGEDGRLKIKIEYISPMALSQRAALSRGIMQYSGFLGQTATVRGPEALDNLKWDQAEQMVAENMGVPAELLPSQDELAQVRQARAQAQAQAQAAAAALEGAKVMPALSKGPESGSPLDLMQRQLQEGAGAV